MKKVFYVMAILFFASCSKQEVNLSPESLNASGTDLPSVSASQEYSGYEIVPNEVIVRFKPEVTENQRNMAINAISGNVLEHIHTNAMKKRGDKDGIFLIRTSLNAINAISKGKTDATIEYIEPNYIYQHTAITNDTYFSNGSLWGLGNTSSVYGSNAATAWAAGKTGSRAVYIGIIDEGVMNTHEDIGANFGVNPFETAGNGIDDDGNGLIDDVNGWDFDGNNNSIFDGATDDHGTHVAGTIGALANNGKGVVGVNWNVTMLSAKFLGKRGGTTANAIKAVDYFTDLKSKGLNIVATNNSWGGGGFSQALQDAIERANAANILFVAAAGNSAVNIDASASYPAAYPNSNIIAVAAITSSGALASYSNYGATKVDIGAPGSGIWSTIPKSVKGLIVSSYASYNGTSMATPHVSGACALYASIYPGANASAIKNAILSSATPTQSLSGKVLTGGRLNVAGF
ncbi:MAG: S8 family peptidase [Pedobacter sp.]|jgi:subtilisin family serine protease